MIDFSLRVVFIFSFQTIFVMNSGLLLYFNRIERHEEAGVMLIVSALATIFLSVCRRRG